MVKGGIVPGEIMLNAGREALMLQVANSGDLKENVGLEAIIAFIATSGGLAERVR